MANPTSSTPGKDKADATDRSQQQQNKVIDAAKEEDPTRTAAVIPTAGTGSDAVLVRADQEIPEAMFEAAATEDMVRLTAPLVGEFFYPNTVRPSYKILHTVGEIVPRSVVDAHNAGVRLRKLLADNDGVDPANPAGIDSTTIASGTVVSTDSDQAKAVAAGR